MKQSGICVSVGVISSSCEMRAPESTGSSPQAVGNVEGESGSDRKSEACQGAPEDEREPEKAEGRKNRGRERRRRSTRGAGKGHLSLVGSPLRPGAP